MAISLIATAGNSGQDTIAVPSHQTDDLLIIAARRFGSTTPPDLPAGWTNAITENDGANSLRVGYKVAASGSETSGTWTNATQIIAHVMRGTATTVGAVASEGNTSPLAAAIPALTLSSASSWVFGVFETAFESAEPDFIMVRREAIPAPDNLRLLSLDTNGPVGSTSFTADNAILTDGSAHCTASVEIPEAPPPPGHPTMRRWGGIPGMTYLGRKGSW